MSNPVTDLKRELLTAAERQLRHVPAPVRHRGFRGRVRAPRLLLGGAAVAVAIVAALFFTTPWSNSPSFLEKAQAALTPPQGMILHEKWVTTSISCTFRGTADLWFDFDRERIGGQRYRAVVRDPFFPYPFEDTFHHPRCSRGSTYEIGGFTEGSVFRFVPPNRLVNTGLRGGPPPNLALGELDGDPVAALRRALRTGDARDEGRTKRDGRAVEHIRLKWGDAYVDPDTFYPVEIDLPGAQIRFKAYEYLPRTAANVALTNLHAQHPGAIGGVMLDYCWSCETR